MHGLWHSRDQECAVAISQVDSIVPMIPELPKDYDSANPEHASVAEAYFNPSGIERYEHTPAAWGQSMRPFLVLSWIMPFGFVGYEFYRTSSFTKAAAIFGIMLIVPIFYSLCTWFRWRSTKRQAIEIDHENREIRFENYSLNDRFIPKRQPLIVKRFEDVLKAELVSNRGTQGIRLHLTRGTIGITDSIERFDLLSTRLREIARKPLESPVVRQRRIQEAIIMAIAILIVGIVCWAAWHFGWV